MLNDVVCRDLWGPHRQRIRQQKAESRRHDDSIDESKPFEEGQDHAPAEVRGPPERQKLERKEGSEQGGGG